MNSTLLGAGLACIIAAIIGGGLKAFGIEIPVLQSRARQGLLGLFGLSLLGLAYVASLPAEVAAKAPEILLCDTKKDDLVLNNDVDPDKVTPPRRATTF
jgi:hypothetical protein